MELAQAIATFLAVVIITGALVVLYILAILALLKYIGI